MAKIGCALLQKVESTLEGHLRENVSATPGGPESVGKILPE